MTSTNYKNSHTEHCTCTADSTNTKAQNIQHKKYHYVHRKLLTTEYLQNTKRLITQFSPVPCFFLLS